MALNRQILNLASLAGSRLSPSGDDDIGIFSDGYSPMFPGIKILEAQVKPNSKIMQHPVEDGTMIADHKVDLPQEIMLNILLDADNYGVFELIKRAFNEATMLIAQVRGGVYKKMIISEIPHVENTDYYKQLLISLKLQEVIVVKPEYGTLPASKVADKKNASTVKRGQQNASPSTNKPVPEKDKSALYRMFH